MSLNQESLFEDQKNFRKLRKYLRQIEHLNLLTRPLNDEEKNKCSKREQYRKQLNLLNEKYANTDISLDSRDETLEKAEEDHSLLLINSTQFSEQVSPATTTALPKNDSFSKELDLITNMLQNLKTETNDITEEQQDSISNSTKESEIVKNANEKDKSLNTNDSENKPKNSNLVTCNKNKSEPQIVSQPIKPKPETVIAIETFNIDNAHDDLIVSLDVCIESGLIVTGSRDTTIKVWNLENGKLLHGFGGHTGPITCVKFWSQKCYLTTIENLKNETNDSEDMDDVTEFNQDYNEEQDIENDSEINKINQLKNYPFILTSSLDCSLRIWSIYKERCLKQFYLYNPINCFEIMDTSFIIAMDAGKIEFMSNLKKMCSSKVLDDKNSFCCIKFLNSSTNETKFYALTKDGNLILVSINKNKFEILENENLHSKLSTVSTKFTKNFKYFEIINENQLLILNDNQSFIIFYDLSKKDSFKLVSTNTTHHGFTNCIFKIRNQYFISAYDIDNGSSSVNVFEYNSETSKDSFKYKYTIQDKELDSYCISAISCCELPIKNNSQLMVTSSHKQIKVWSLKESTNKKFKKDQLTVKYVQMSKKLSMHQIEDNGEDFESNSEKDEDEDSDTNEPSDDNNKNSKSYCQLQ